MATSSLLLLVAPLVLLAIALRGGQDLRRPATLRMIAFVLVLATSVPLIFAPLWRFDATRVAIELHGIGFRSHGAETVRREVRERRAGSGRVVIGDPASRSARSRDRLFGALVFQPGSARGEGKLTVELPSPAQRTGVVSAQGQGLLGAQSLEDGDRLCVAGRCWTYDDEERSFTSGSHVAQITPRIAQIPGLGWKFALRWASPAAAAQRTWSLDWLAHSIGAVPPERHLRSLLCYWRGEKRLQLLILDDGVELQRAGKAVPQVLEHAVSNGQRLAFHTLPPESPDFVGNGLTERRSMVARVGERSVALDLDTPEIHSLSVAELRALEMEQKKDATKRVVALSMGDAQLVDRSLYFSGLSESVAVEANALVEVSRLFPHDLRSSYRAISPRGPVGGFLGKTIWIGASDLAAVRIDVLRPPLLLLTAGLVLVVLKIMSAFAARLSLTQILLLGAIEVLAGIRLLLGYRVWSMPPYRIEAAELASMAWMALPWMFLVASIGRDAFAALRRGASREALAMAGPALAGLTLSAVFTMRVIEGRTKWIWVLCHLLAIGVALLRDEEVRARLARIRFGLVERWNRIGWLQRIKANPIVLAALMFTVVRVVLLMFGFKESVTLGARVSLSVLHIPLAVMLEGLFLWRLWQRSERFEGMTGSDWKEALAILAFVWCIPAVLTSDIGLALLNVPVFVFLLLAIERKAAALQRHASRGSRLFARALVVLALVVIAGGPLMRLALPLIGDEEFLLSAASDSNYARFLHFAAPERLRDLATKRGESLAITSAILQSYISSGLFGRGYGHTDVSPHLGDTALRDFAPAVFVAAEWGLIGTVALLVTYLLFLVITHPLLPWSQGGRNVSRPGPVIAFVSAATIATSSIYMILANHELLLLTGKNAYLLGLDSAGDVMEVVLLLLLIAYGAATAREEQGGMLGGTL